MSATAHQRRRRVTALQLQCEELGIDCTDFGLDELRYKQAIEEAVNALGGVNEDEIPEGVEIVDEDEKFINELSEAYAQEVILADEEPEQPKAKKTKK